MKVLWKTLQFGLALVVTLAAMEVYLQFAEIQTPMETRIDPDIGPTFIPNKKVTRFNEGFYVGGTNKYGYLGPEHTPENPGEGKRILLLGDSYVMGMTVFTRHHFARELERDLEESTGFKVETLNFGKADFNLSNMYQYYQDFASDFDHDLALFFVDQADLVPARQFDRDLYPVCFMEDGEIKIDYSFSQNQKYLTYKKLEPISTYSALFRLTYNARKMVARGELGTVVLDKFSFLVRDEKPVSAEPQVGKKAPDWTVPILAELARDPKNILVTKNELSPEVAALVKGTGINTVDITQALNKLEAEGVDPFFWPVSGKRGHWNQKAHAAIGRFLAIEIKDDLLRSGE
jgi:hypothetical protein